MQAERDVIGTKESSEVQFVEGRRKNGIMGLQVESLVKTAVPLSLSRISLKA